MRSRPAALTAASFIALAGCSIESDVPVNSSATAVTSPSASPSAADVPESDVEVGADWVDEATATAGLAAFLNTLPSADRYRVERIEQFTFSPGVGVETHFDSVVDVVQERAESTQYFAVSDDDLWLELAGGDEDAIEHAQWLRPHTVVDFSADQPVTYLTFLGPQGWDDKWLIADRDDFAAVEDGAAMAEQLAHSSIDQFSATLATVAALEPNEFDATLTGLAYDVPPATATAWLPEGLRLALEEEGADFPAVRSPGGALVTPINGGIEGFFDLTQVLQEAAATLPYPEVPDQVEGLSVTIVVRIYAVDGGVPVRLPAPSSIVTEPPAT